MNQTVHVVGFWPDDESKPWEVVGVFTTPEAAEAQCVTPMYFVGPIELDKATPKETTAWPGCRYPLANCEAQP